MIKSVETRINVNQAQEELNQAAQKSSKPNMTTFQQVQATVKQEKALKNYNRYTVLWGKQ
jgi:hypothetical protein